MERFEDKLMRFMFGVLVAVAVLMFGQLKSYASVDNHEYTEIVENATEKDWKELEKVVFNESGFCSLEVKQAVIETVLNRVVNGWGDTIYEVCSAKNQFDNRPYTTDEYTQESICDAIELVYHEGRTVLPSTSYVFFATKKQTLAKNHIFLGEKRPYRYMYFGEKK